MMKLTVIGVAIAVGLVVAFGLYLFGIGLRNVGRAAASSRWPRTAGAALGPVHKNNLARRHSRGRKRSRDHKGTHKERHNPDIRLHRKIRDRRAARTNVE